MRTLHALTPATAETLLTGLSRLGTPADVETTDEATALTRHELVFAAVSAGISPDEAEAIIDALLALHVFRANEGWSNEQLAEAVSQSPDMGLEADESTSFQARLGQYLAVGAVAIISKAFDVLGDYEHVFGHARILTDARPVFGDDPRAGPLGMVIVQTLKLDYFLQDGQPKSFYVAMENSKLNELREKLDRAAAKAEALQGTLARSGVPYVQPEQDNTTERL